MSFNPWKLVKRFIPGTLVRADGVNEKLEGIEQSFTELDAIYKTEMLRLPAGYTASNKIPNKTLNNALLYFDANANLDVYHLATLDSKVQQAADSATAASASAATAGQHASNANNSANQASSSAQSASDSAASAATFKNVAFELANSPEDTPVSSGGFSALHYAAKAEQAAALAYSHIGGTAENSAKLGNQLPSYYAKASDVLTPVPLNAKFTDTWRGISDSLALDDSSVSASAKATKVLKSFIDGLVAGSIPFNRTNFNHRHFITENDGGGNFNIRVGHQMTVIDGVNKAVVTEVGTQFHIRFDNESNAASIVYLVADGYAVDGAVGDVITSWREAASFGAESVKLFGDLFKIENGVISSNAAPVQSKRMQFNPPQGTIVRKAPVEKLVFGNWGSEWRTFTLDDNTFQVNDEVVIDWINDTASRAIIKASTAVIYYNGVAQANGINIFGKPKQVVLTKISTNSWAVIGLYLDHVAYQHYPTLSVLIKEAVNAKFTNWNGTNHSYTIDSDSFDSGDTLEFIRSYSGTGSITVTLNAGSIFFNDTALGAQVRNAGRPHKLVLEKANDNSWIMRVEKLGVAQ